MQTVKAKTCEIGIQCDIWQSQADRLIPVPSKSPDDHHDSERVLSERPTHSTVDYDSSEESHSDESELNASTDES